MEIYTKLNANELEVTKTPTPVEEVLTYDVKTLNYNKTAIIAEIAKFTLEKEKELADIEILLAKCVELQIVEKVIEPPIKEIIKEPIK